MRQTSQTVDTTRRNGLQPRAQAESPSLYLPPHSCAPGTLPCPSWDRAQAQGTPSPGLPVSLPLPLTAPGRERGAGLVTGIPCPTTPPHPPAACLLQGGQVSSPATQPPSLDHPNVFPLPDLVHPGGGKEMGKTKSVGKVQRMTRTQRAPREGQKQGKGRGPGMEPWRNTSERERAEEKTGTARSQREALSLRVRLARAEADRPYPPACVTGAGGLPRCGLGWRSCHRPTPPDQRTSPHPLPGLASPQRGVLPTNSAQLHPSPCQHGFTKLPQLGWTKRCLLTRLRALRKPPFPPPVSSVLKKKTGQWADRL